MQKPEGSIGGKMYPLLTAWLNGQLRQAWQNERAALKANDPKLLDWVLDHEAAAWLCVKIGQEYDKLSAEAKRSANWHRHDPNYTDATIEFYDRLQDDALPSYRGVLQDISGNRSLMADEIRISQALYASQQ